MSSQAGKLISSKHGALGLKLHYKGLNWNTKLWNGLTTAQKDQMRLTALDVKGSDVRYKILPPYPKTYNPRSPARMPKEEYPNWFYTDEKGQLASVIAYPLDQGKCGSCWAFAATDVLTDTIRHMLMTIFGGKACFYSPLFNPLTTCTGETGVENVVRGITNIGTGNSTKCNRDKDCKSGVCMPNKTCLELFGVEVRDRISVYFTIGFAPQLKDTCKATDPLDKCMIQCSEWYNEWKRALTTPYILKGGAEELGPDESVCVGCEGNAIVMPLYMFVNRGAPLLSTFPAQDWACIYGNAEMRKTFCTDEFLVEYPVSPMPKLIQADRYGHFIADDIIHDHPPGISTMEEWIQGEIINNATVSIGYMVYPAFFSFFEERPKGIFTFKYFKEAISKGGQEAAGGHAVDIIGWDEDEQDGEMVQYWIVRNSWGEEWGDEGFFRFERRMDGQLRKAKLDAYLTHFEDEFGTLYYAPYPNENLYNSNHYTEIQVGNKKVKISKRLAETVHIPPSEHCVVLEESKRQLARTLQKCLCPPGYVKNTSEICVKDITGSSYGSNSYNTNNGSNGWGLWVGLGLLVGLLILLVWYWKIRKF